MINAITKAERIALLKCRAAGRFEEPRVRSTGQDAIDEQSAIDTAVPRDIYERLIARGLAHRPTGDGRIRCTLAGLAAIGGAK